MNRRVTFTQAYRAALFVLTITVGAVFVTGKGGALDTAAHLTSMFVPPAETHILTGKTQVEDEQSTPVQTTYSIYTVHGEQKSKGHHGVVVQ